MKKVLFVIESLSGGGAEKPAVRTGDGERDADRSVRADVRPGDREGCGGGSGHGKAQQQPNLLH